MQAGGVSFPGTPLRRSSGLSLLPSHYVLIFGLCIIPEFFFSLLLFQNFNAVPFIINVSVSKKGGAVKRFALFFRIFWYTSTSYYKPLHLWN